MSYDILLFQFDIIFVKGFQSHYVTLKSINHNKFICLYMSDLNYLGLWFSNYVDFNGKFKEKESMIPLKPNEIFQCHFIIEIN